MFPYVSLIEVSFIVFNPTQTHSNTHHYHKTTLIVSIRKHLAFIFILLLFSFFYGFFSCGRAHFVPFETRTNILKRKFITHTRTYVTYTCTQCSHRDTVIYVRGVHEGIGGIRKFFQFTMAKVLEYYIA